MATQWARQLTELVKEVAAGVEGAGKKWNMWILHPSGMGNAFRDVTNLMKSTMELGRTTFMVVHMWQMQDVAVPSEPQHGARTERD